MDANNSFLSCLQECLELAGHFPSRTLVIAIMDKPLHLIQCVSADINIQRLLKTLPVKFLFCVWRCVVIRMCFQVYRRNDVLDCDSEESER